MSGGKPATGARMVEVEASVLIDAPRDDVFAILTEYGGEARVRINPKLKAQRVLERSQSWTLCENVWETDGREIVGRRRYRVAAPGVIEEEVVAARSGLVRVTTRVQAEGDQTRLTMVSAYRLGPVWNLLARLAIGRLRESDEQLLATLKDGIEAEFEDDT